MKSLLNKKVVIIFSSVLIVTAAVFAAQWKWHFWQSGWLQQSSSANTQEIDNPDFDNASIPDEMAENAMMDMENGAVHQEAGIREVLAAQLFGQEKSAQPTNAADVPKSQQPIELHGIVYVPKHPERSVALISQAGGTAKDYKIGDELTEILAGWKVFSIAGDAVLIDNDGTKERLEVVASNVSQSASYEQPVMAVDQPVMANPNAMPDENAALMDEGSQAAGVDEQVVPNEAIPPPEDDAATIDNATPVPESEAAGEELSIRKEIDGFLLESPKSAQALGLKAADKIIAISGYEMQDLENEPTALKEILAQPKIEALIDRGGETVIYNVPKKLIKNWRNSFKS